MPQEISRKEFFKRLSILGISAVSVSTFLEACGGNKNQPHDQGQQQTEKQSPTNSQPDPCSDVSSLTEAQLKNRETLEYVGHSPFTDKFCANCSFFIIPENNGPCGKCQVVKGPINPMGHCTAWVAKQK